MLPIPTRRLGPTLLPMSPSPLMPALSLSPPDGPRNSSSSTIGGGLLFESDSVRRRWNSSLEERGSAVADSVPSLDPRLERAVSPLTLHTPESPPCLGQARALHESPREDSARELSAGASSSDESVSVTATAGSPTLGFLTLDTDKSDLHKSSADPKAVGPSAHDPASTPDTEPSCWRAPCSAPLERRSQWCCIVPPPPPLARADSYPPFVPSSFLATGSSPLPPPTSVKHFFEPSLPVAPPPLEPTLLSNPLSSSTSLPQPPAISPYHQESQSNMTEQSSTTPQKIVVSLPSSTASRGASSASRGQGDSASSTKGSEASQRDGQSQHRTPPLFSIRDSTSSTRGRIARQGPITRSASGSTPSTLVTAAIAAKDSVATSPSTAPISSAGIYASRWATDDTEPASTQSPATPSRASTRGGRRRGRGGRGRGGSITSRTSTGTPPRSGTLTPKEENQLRVSQSEADQLAKNETPADEVTTLTGSKSSPQTDRHASSRNVDETSTMSITSTDEASLSLSKLSIAENKDDVKTSTSIKEPLAKSSPAPRRVYPTRDRVSTGGLAKPRMTTEELEAKMARMRIENEKTQAQHDKLEAERAEAEEQKKAAKAAREEQRKAEVAKQERSKKLQSDIDATRARSAAMKMAAIQGRAWDQEKLNRDDNDISAAPSYPSEELGPLVRDHLGRMITAPTGAVIHHIGVKDDNAVWDRVEHYEDDSEEDEEEARAVAEQLTGNKSTAQD
ncbi:BZ3500_MvSof-1268-A1-R1_Chr6-3g08737 [Microbotryum saponariae]|uniref:BZ3500_MvSof-1268-A1-R1_Chr6-3g08737 protein n=1 Tax=Microbotryum saponariae TaxID=289078 RepID=A0A2X0KPZ1_9BASI|nr:BZ3500_MvSof-1268-A1-R1_Chr6-3g08737 [Microbotryum saponariae]SDA07338.1 BZ3501_MvSof-1269-A2-R1_Chr6-2g08440 [Microbotryum saponariae]